MSILYKPKILTVRWDAPFGWLVSDLVEDGYARKHENCSLHTSNHSQYFQIIDNRLLVQSPIKHLQGRTIAIVVQTIAPERVFAINVHISGSLATRFSSDVYGIKIREDTAPETLVPSSPEITLINSSSSNLHISIISNSTNLPFVIVAKRRQNLTYARVTCFINFLSKMRLFFSCFQ
ncbi:unnamed protein product [Gongylonema pulchrum]|uniref:Cadherin domain-containing protein n=1 Tax=Gongylonema pulchrum TaxID=637853 RepID=A0A183D1X5_9BILA|nr:unnamed protein product [Gongylonema pulchrum]